MTVSTFFDRCLRIFGACSATVCFLWILCIYSTQYHGRGILRDVEPSHDSILITGARSGIGRHAALTMNQQGFTVFAGVRREGDGKELLESATYPEKMVIVQLDVTKQEDIRSAVGIIEDNVGEKGLTAIFHNAGLVPSLPKNVPRHEKSLSVEVTPLETFRKAMEVEYFGAIAVTKACLELLERYASYHNDSNTKTARIVFNSDAKMTAPYAGHTFGPLFATYAMANSLRWELLHKGTGVDVIDMQPGGIATKSLLVWLNAADSTEFSDKYAPMEKATFEFAAEQIIEESASPQATSDALLDAVLSSKPHKNYYPGHNAYAGYVFGHWVPDSWVEYAMMNMKPTGKINDPEWKIKARNKLEREFLPMEKTSKEL